VGVGLGGIGFWVRINWGDTFRGRGKRDYQIRCGVFAVRGGFVPGAGGGGFVCLPPLFLGGGGFWM